MNLGDYWNYILASLDVVGLIALRAVGQKKAVGWLWAMLTQSVWIVYSIATFQWGFLAVALIKLAVYTWNWLSWVRSDKKAATEAGDQKVGEMTVEEIVLELVERTCPDASLITKGKYATVITRFALTAQEHTKQEATAR